jgi:hypothetical protein
LVASQRQRVAALRRLPNLVTNGLAAPREHVEMEFSVATARLETARIGNAVRRANRRLFKAYVLREQLDRL